MIVINNRGSDFMTNELLEQLKQAGISTRFDGKTVSFVYDEKSQDYLEKLLVDFYDQANYDLLLLNQNGSSQIRINGNQANLDPSLLFERLSWSLSTYDQTVDYVEKMNPQLRNSYELFKRSLEYEGKFGIGVQNLPNQKKYRIRTDMKEMLEVLRKAGFVVEGNQVRFPEEMGRSLEEALSMALQELSPASKSKEQPEELAVGESKVDYYEKFVRNKTGENILVRMAIVKQNKEDSQYDRLITVSYIDKENGVAVSNEVFGYEDGYQFDQDALPSIIDGFSKNVTSSGREVTVNEMNSTTCYLSSGDNEDSIYLEGYSVNSIESIVAADKEHNLFGNEEGKINLQQLEQDDVIQQEENLQPSFEEQVTGNNSPEKGPTRVLKLGEMPTSSSTSSSGLANYGSLIFFLVVDVLAIAVGIYLLMQ